MERYKNDVQNVNQVESIEESDVMDYPNTIRLEDIEAIY